MRASAAVPILGATARLLGADAVYVGNAPALLAVAAVGAANPQETALAAVLRADAILRAVNAQEFTTAPNLAATAHLLPGVGLGSSATPALFATARLLGRNGQLVGTAPILPAVAFLRAPGIGAPPQPGTGVLVAVPLSDYAIRTDPEHDWVLESVPLSDYVLLATVELTVNGDKDQKTYRPGDSIEFRLKDMYRKVSGVKNPITALGGSDSIVFNVYNESNLSVANGTMTNGAGEYADDWFGIFSAPTPAGHAEDFEVEATANVQGRSRTLGLIVHVEKPR
jgi:hypothetical protein